MNGTESPRAPPEAAALDARRRIDELKTAVEQLRTATQTLESQIGRWTNVVGTIERLEHEVVQRQEIEAALRASDERFRAEITERVEAERALKKEEDLLRQMLAIQDRDRRLLAYEIHDGLAQQLAGALLLLQSYREIAAANPAEAWKTFDAGVRTLSQGVSEARRLISGLRPPVLDESGVVAAIEHLVYEAQRSGGPVIDFSTDVHFDRLAPTLENALFRIVQEALTNACRYSQSQKVLVRLTQRGDRVRAEIRDWGVGFILADVRGQHFGLQGIQERARLISGRAIIRSIPGKGTRILIDLPLIPPA
jgi:signal transduction histidine kinase